LLTQYCAGDKIDKNVMGGPCSTYGERRDVYTGLRWGNLRERDHWGDPVVDGRVILRWIFKIEKNVMGGPCSTYGGEERRVHRFWWGNLRERDHWGDSGVDGRVILRWIFRKSDVGLWTGLGWHRIGTGGGSL